MTSSEKVPIAERKQNQKWCHLHQLGTQSDQSETFASFGPEFWQVTCFLLKLRIFVKSLDILSWKKLVNGAQKVSDLNVNNLWQCETTQKSIIVKLPAFGKLTFIKFLSIRTNQVNLKVRFCVVLLSKMAFDTEFYPVIFHFEIQKKHGKHLKIQIIFRICMSNIIYDLIMAELKIFLQYEPSTV